MKKTVLVAVVTTMFLTVSILTVGIVSGRKSSVSSNGGIALQRPYFVDIVKADSDVTQNGFDIGEHLDEEAGISTYYQTPDVIDLDLIRDLFTTIEIETSEYILGSVDAPDYAEVYDAHVYVHVSGWVLVYYPNTDPASKIVNVRAQSVDTTIIEIILQSVVGAAGYGITDITYYDFRYPNATNMMLVGEALSGDNWFTIELPVDYAYQERSWSLWDGGGSEYFRVNEVNVLGNSSYWNGTTGYGYINAGSLVPGTTNTIAVDDYGVLVIVYRIP